MTDSTTAHAASAKRPRSRGSWRLPVVVATILLLLFSAPWWTLLGPGNQWPGAVVTVGTVALVAVYGAFPFLMALGRRDRDRINVAGESLLGGMWVLFVWSLLGQLLGLALLWSGIDDPIRSRIVAGAVVVVVSALLAWGHFEAMRVPRLRQLDVTIPRLGAGLDGLRVAVVTDTHYGPIDRTRWSAAMVDRLNDLDADVVCHVGDLADGTVANRRSQAAPLADVRAKLARVYVTGNHEYYSEALDWLDFMADAGWETLRNKHIVVERGGDRLVVAGVDDATARASGLDGHGADLDAALRDADPDLPVLLLAHQPKQVKQAVAAGVDLQLSGHTHGGQIWPFGLLVRLDQPVVRGLSRHGSRTQLYTSAGAGFWGPPFRVFAPSELTLLTLRAAA